ncbi:MAG: tail fiber domain-containing protein, partial [Cytophagales bacterium]|nr:tail fiber domain-containing protein [Cytophagales bacterium]
QGGKVGINTPTPSTFFQVVGTIDNGLLDVANVYANNLLNVPGVYYSAFSAGIQGTNGNNAATAGQSDGVNMGQNIGITGNALNSKSKNIGTSGAAQGGGIGVVNQGLLGFAGGRVTGIGAYNAGMESYAENAPINYGIKTLVSGSVGGTNYGLFGASYTTNATATNYGVYGEAFNGGTNWAGYFNGNTAVVGNLYIGTGIIYSRLRNNFFLALQADRNMVLYDNNAAVWAANTGVSDIRAKENIKPLEDVLPVLQELNIIRFNYKPEFKDDKRYIGVIAQEIVKNYPEFVYHDAKADRYVVYYDKLVSLAIKGIQELNSKIIAQEKSIAALTKECLGIKYALTNLEERVNGKASISK